MASFLVPDMYERKFQTLTSMLRDHGNLVGQDGKGRTANRSVTKFILILVVVLPLFGHLIENYSKLIILISLVVTFIQRSKLTSRIYFMAFLIRLVAYPILKLFPPQNMAIKLLFSSFHLSFVTMGLFISFLQILEIFMGREDILSIIIYNFKLCIMPKERNFESREHHRWPILGTVRQYSMPLLFILTAIVINLIIGFLRQQITENTIDNQISSFDIIQFIISILLTVAIFRTIMTESTALDVAIYEDDEDAIVTLIAAGSEERKNNKSTPLCIAIRENKMKAVKALINVGVDVNEISEESTPLSLALKTNNMQAVNALIEAKADVNQESKESTPLCIAVKTNNTQAVKALIEAKADVNQESKDGAPLNAAIQGNDLEIVKILYDAGADVNLEIHSELPLQHAIREHRSEVANTLIEYGTDVNALTWGQSALHTAIREQMNDVLKALINAGADINIKAQGRSLIDYATLYGNIEAKEILHQKVAESLRKKTLSYVSGDMEKDINYLAQAIEAQNVTDLQTLVKLIFKSANVDKLDWNILYIASAKGTVGICAYLIEEGFPVDTFHLSETVHRHLFSGKERDPTTKVSPLMASALFERSDVFSYLVKLTGDRILETCNELVPEIEAILLEEICGRLKLKYQNLKPTVIAGTQNGNTVLVVYSDSYVQRHDNFCGKKVIFRNPRMHPIENTEPLIYKTGKLAQIAQETMQIAKQIIQEQANNLWQAHSNLNIISVSSGKCVRGISSKQQCCISLYCTSKGIIPYGENTFPTFLCSNDGKQKLPVDVREGYFELCPKYETLPSNSLHETLKMGCSIGSSCSGGTLGPFAELDGNLGFLTCSHVFFDINNTFKYHVDATSQMGTIKVEQPAPGTFYSSSRVDIDPLCGVVEKAVFDPDLPVSVDAAFVRITNTNRAPTQGEFAIDNQVGLRNAGFSEQPVYNSGTFKEPKDINTMTVVVKFGSSTHLTKGCLLVDGAQVRPMEVEFGHVTLQKPHVLKNQMQIESVGLKSFFQPGDSGSAVFVVNSDRSLECIGMAIGCTSDNFAIVTPIRAILETLRVELMSFP